MRIAFRHRVGRLECGKLFRIGTHLLAQFRQFLPNDFARPARCVDAAVLEFLVLVEFLALKFFPDFEVLFIGCENLVSLVFAEAVHEVGSIRQMFFPIERIHAAIEDAVERIIIGGWDWIEFVIVASGASDTKAQKCFTQIVDGVLDVVLCNDGADLNAGAMLYSFETG